MFKFLPRDPIKNVKAIREKDRKAHVRTTNWRYGAFC